MPKTDAFDAYAPVSRQEKQIQQLWNVVIWLAGLVWG